MEKGRQRLESADIKTENYGELWQSTFDTKAVRDDKLDLVIRTSYLGYNRRFILRRIVNPTLIALH